MVRVDRYHRPISGWCKAGEGGETLEKGVEPRCEVLLNEGETHGSREEEWRGSVERRMGKEEGGYTMREV